MSNRIDFFQSEQISLALPAASVSIFVDGLLSPNLEPIEIVRSEFPQFNWSRVAYNTAAYKGGDLTAPDNIDALFPVGKSLSIKGIYNSTASGTKISTYAIFEGQIEKIETRLYADCQIIEIIARDFSANLERIIVYGQQIANLDGSEIFMAGFDTVFNPDGKGNASISLVEINGKNYRIFSTDVNQGGLWSYADVIFYLLNQYITAGQLCIPDFKRLQALTENQTVRDLDVTGLNLIDALQRCCERIGLKFKFEPMPGSLGPAQAIVFYKNNSGRTVALNCQRATEQLSISRTNIAALNRIKNLHPVTHKYIGQGDYKVFEATFDLIKGWDSSLEANTVFLYSPSTNPNFYKVRDVFRKWTLNEAGDYSEAPYNRGEACDLSRIFQSTNYVCRRRRFWPTLTTDSQNRSLGYYLQVSYDQGQTWWQYRDAYNVLVDECGVWLSSDQLDINMLLACVDGQLKFRITASIISDERLSAAVVDGPKNSTAPVVENLITLPRQFKYKKISSLSIFAGSVDGNLGIPDEKDDTEALYEFVRHTAESSPEVIETIDVQTPILDFNYHLGDKIATSSESRDLLKVHNSRSIARIEKVQMDFRKQCTNLKIVRNRNV